MARRSYTKIVANGIAQWVKVVPAKERVAAFLETHRYALRWTAAAWASPRWKGTTVNIKDKIAYSARSERSGLDGS